VVIIDEGGNQESKVMFTALFWKKAWIWLKHYWYWPVIIVLLIFSMVSDRGLKEKLFGLLEKSKENHDKEIQIIKETTEEADKKKTEIFTEHIEELEKIEEEHNIKIEELEEEKQKELVAKIEENKDSPDKLAQEVAKVLSAEFLKNNR